MAKKLSAWRTKGMNRDMSVSVFNSEFAFENVNLRLSTNDNNTQMSWVNEKGPKELPINCRVNAWSADAQPQYETSIQGKPIGTAVINHQLVLFTTPDNSRVKDSDRIYVLYYSNPLKTELEGTLLFKGNLNFDVKHPIETLVSYEAENIQKVYWVDGKNQARLINIKAETSDLDKWHSISTTSVFTLFDFVNEMKLQEIVGVKKLLGASGMFAPGVIQYAFTYYKKYGQETNIFYTTPLLYISHKDRGASPEDKVDNAFRITITKVDDSFDYLRIYSIQRTSINATPICKRVQDIDITKLNYIPNVGYQAVYIDTGVSGNSIDPMELLYKGGRTIIPNTLEQKDNTLFFGNFSLEKIPYNVIRQLALNPTGAVSLVEPAQGQGRQLKPVEVSSGSYIYHSQLTATNADGSRTVPCGGFKTGDYYRFGVQFQYKTGEWSSPVYVPYDYDSNHSPIDFQIKTKPAIDTESGTITLPCVKGYLGNVPANTLMTAGYRKIRPVVVFPDIQDRVTLCQGVVAPTLYTQSKREDEGGISAQSSWFFRTRMTSSYPAARRSSQDDELLPPGSVAPYIGDDGGFLEYTRKGVETGDAFTPNNIRRVEIEGNFDEKNRFRVDKNILTFHSPDIEFDTKLSVVDLSGFSAAVAGSAVFSKTVSDIDIQTETPPISNRGSGFVHRSFREDGPYGIVSGLFYDDKVVDDNDGNLEGYYDQHKIGKWMVYLWNKNGSLNNDFERPADKGVRSAVLKKKIISNLRYADTSYLDGNNLSLVSGSMQLFSSDDLTILKWKSGDKDRLYQGNIDTMITPDHVDGMYFCVKQTIKPQTPYVPDPRYPFAITDNSAYADISDNEDVDTPFNSNDWWKTFNMSEDTQDNYGLRRYNSKGDYWEISNGHVGDNYALSLCVNKEPVRIKYKSTPHYVFETSGTDALWDIAALPVVEIRKEPNQSTIFGGKSDDALKENVWVPCGEPVFLGNRLSDGRVEFEYSYGDTYFQRWDCLKTYAYTPEDINQIIEIGSFMLESRMNIDGRYDRNRGQSSNLYVSPQNFNLFNPVYSQVDNFFTYRIQDEKDYLNTEFPNQITWSKTKTSGADVDLYTNVTMASVLEMDGDKGSVRKLIRFNDQLLCFQDKGIAQVLYNENMQMSTTEGVPIEIANSGKVNGKRYVSDAIGCSNKWSIAQALNGIYFMDSINKAIFIFNGQLSNLSVTFGFNSWAKKNIAGNDFSWNPEFPVSEESYTFTSFYDKLNQDVHFVNSDISLAFSEKMAGFTSFYDYGHTPFFVNLNDTGVWLRKHQNRAGEWFTVPWKNNAGEYCNFFGENKPFSMTLVGNPEPQMDKIFTNMEFRATVDGDGVEDGLKFISSLPFDYLETWDEYQHGIANLANMRGHAASLHHTPDNNASLKRKYRIWRCDIPRDNFEAPENNVELSIFRARRHPMDRMRNPWLYLKLMKKAAASGSYLSRTEVHDLLMTYYD